MKIVEILGKIVEMHKLILFECVRMIEITKETWRKNGVEVIVFNLTCWLNEKHIEDLRLVFKLHYVFNTKQQTVVETLKDVFEGENMKPEYYVLGNRTDLYFQ